MKIHTSRVVSFVRPELSARIADVAEAEGTTPAAIVRRILTRWESDEKVRELMEQANHE